MLHISYLIFLFGLGSCACSKVSTLDNDLGYKTNRPVIGVLVQEIYDEIVQLWPGYTSYTQASVVKFFEGGGGRVVPIWIGKPRSYYEEMMTKVNGILFLSGFNNLTNFDNLNEEHSFPEAAEHIFNIAKELNDNGVYFPLLGSCLGFQTLLYVSNQKQNFLTDCAGFNLSMPLDFSVDYETSRMFGSAPNYVIDILKNEPVMPHLHFWCLTPENATQFGLDKDWTALSHNVDENGLEFISTVEHKRYPFYGLAYHPEDVLYEWCPDLDMAHTANAAAAAQYYALFFVNECRKNGNGFASIEEENRMLINNYPVRFARRVSPSFLPIVFDELYLFKSDADYLSENKIARTEL